MPIIVLASRLCPEGMEGTIYALIMSINNMGGIISSQVCIPKEPCKRALFHSKETC